MPLQYLFRNSNLLFSNAVNDSLKNIMVVEDFGGSVRVLQYPANLMVRVTKSGFGEIECVDECVQLTWVKASILTVSLG